MFKILIVLEKLIFYGQYNACVLMMHMIFTRPCTRKDLWAEEVYDYSAT